jgi:hypothetical protein
MKFEQSIGHKEYIIHLFESFKYLCTEGTEIKFSKRNRKAVETLSLFRYTKISNYCQSSLFILF